jgi:hypothetical protein
VNDGNEPGVLVGVLPEPVVGFAEVVQNVAASESWQKNEFLQDRLLRSNVT